MAVVVISGVVMCVVWCLVAFVTAYVIGRAFARSEQGEPWCVGSGRERLRLVQTDQPLDDKIPSRSPVTY